MKQELVRINSIDWIEQPGILYTPDTKTNKIVIHVHGLNGNFYENRFLDTLSKAYTDKNYAFLTFNNRGRWFISELLKGDDFIVIGWCLERFKDCILDIQGVVNWGKSQWFEEIILEWHSYWCNKVLYYYNNTKNDCIKKIVLLAPCDIPTETKKFLSKKEYEKAKSEATKLVKENKENELIDFSSMANGKIAAGTFFYDFLPNWENDFIRYSEKTQSKILNNIDIPVLVIFGDSDKCVLTQPIEIVKQYLSNNIKNCNIQIIKWADHWYNGKIEELWNTIKENF
jgi:pimeloyl-ACP methyl ester carboxylesterase